MALYQLYIDEELVLQSPGDGAPVSVISLVSFERTYDAPSKLVFVVHGDWRSPPYSADAIVALFVDEVLVFHGLLDLPRPTVRAGGYPAIEYAAYDRGRALTGPTVLGEDDRTSIELRSGALSTLIDTYLERVQDLLTTHGFDDVVDYVGGASTVQAMPVTLDAEPVDGGFHRIAAAAPGVHVFIKPYAGGHRYCFVAVFAAPTYDLVLDGAIRVEELNIQQSIDGCAGAVRTLMGQTMGQADVQLPHETALAPAWDTELEAQWTWRQAFTKDASGAPTAMAAVFRRFSFEAVGDEITPETPMAAMVQVVGGEDSVWQQQAIVAVDHDAKTLDLNLPAIKSLSRFKPGRLNSHVPGRAKAAPAKLRYNREATASTPIIIASARHPAEGYSGRAYTLAPITCGFTQIIQAPPGVNIADYVISAHAALSEPIVQGDIQISGELPAALWFLSRSINLTTAEHGSTGYEALAAPLMGIRVEFSAGGWARLSFSADHTDLLRGGV